MALLLATVSPAVLTEAAMMASAGRSMDGALCCPTTGVPAILLPVVVAAAEVEGLGAQQAAQLVEGDALVHPPSRMDRNWTGATESVRLRGYGPPRTVP
jgi:hypothetical protein